MDYSSLRFAMLSPSLSHPIVQIIWSGALERARELGIEMNFLSGGFLKNISIKPDPDSLSFSYGRLDLFDGLIVYGASLGQFSTAERIRDFILAFDKPVVNIGLQLDDITCVNTDNYWSLYHLVEHLIEKHHCSTFAFIEGPPQHQEAKARKQALVDALDRHGLSVNLRLLPGDFSVLAGRKAVEALIASGDPLPHAIACVDDDTALGASLALAQGGYRIPQDVKLIGFDDSEFALLTQPPLSTVHNEQNFQGSEAVDALVGLVSGSPIELNRVLDSRMVIRESCGCIPIEADLDPGVVRALEQLHNCLDIDPSSDPHDGVASIRTILRPLRLQDLYSLQGHLAFNSDVLCSDQRSLIAYGVQQEAIRRELQNRLGVEQRFAELKLLSLDLDEVQHSQEMVETIVTGVRNLGFGGMVLFDRAGGLIADDRSWAQPPKTYRSSRDYMAGLLSPRHPKDLNLIVVPFIHNEKNMGHGAFWVPRDAIGIVDYVANDIGNLFHRMLLLDGMRSQSLQLEESLAKLRSAQKRLVESEKMAALGGLISGVAHELNTPIGISLTALTYLETEVSELIGLIDKNGDGPGSDKTGPLKSGITKSTELLEQNIRRTAKIIEQFRSLTMEIDDEEFKSFELMSSIERMVGSVSSFLIQGRCEISVSGPDQVEVFAPLAVIHQFLTTTITNALDHAFTNVERPKLTIDVSTNHSEVIIVVADNGYGVDAEIHDRLFEPFFTTKRGDGHIGLGLHSLYLRVRQALDGELRFSSTVGKGSTVTLRFPWRGKGDGFNG